MSNLRRLPHPRYLVGVIVAAVLIGTTALVPPQTGCDEDLRIQVNSSTEKFGIIKELAARYSAENRSVSGFCAKVDVDSRTSGSKKNELAEGRATPPDVWLPTSSMWISMLGKQGYGQRIDASASSHSVTASSLVIAMPESAITALKDDDQEMRSWKHVLQLARNDWPSYGKPEWGDFILGRDNPETSTSGLAATVATYHAATGGHIDERSLVDPKVVDFVREIESSVTRPGDEAVDFMTDIYQYDQRPGNSRPYLDAVVVQEQMAYLYNKGAPSGNPADIKPSREPKDPLRAIYPNDGTIELDHPYAVLAQRSTRQAVAKDFYRFLKEPEQQQRFTELGFRRADAPSAPTNGLHKTLKAPDKPLRFIKLPERAALEDMVGKWDSVRRKARVLLLLDVSRSMGNERYNPETNTDLTKLMLIRDAATDALNLLNPADEVGLSTFSSDTTEVIPVASLGANKTQFLDAIQDLNTEGNTELIPAVNEASKSMTEAQDPKRVNAIVLLSDGGQRESSGALDDLLNELNPDNREESVPIFTIHYGTDDQPELGKRNPLKEIAKATNGSHYDATDVRTISKVLTDVFRNFR